MTRHLLRNVRVGDTVVYTGWDNGPARKTATLERVDKTEVVTDKGTFPIAHIDDVQRKGISVLFPLVYAVPKARRSKKKVVQVSCWGCGFDYQEAGLDKNDLVPHPDEKDEYLCWMCHDEYTTR